MDLGTRLSELQKRTIEHREVLLTEEAAKTALVMPFIQALGYDVFNPSEVVPEYVADVGTKKGEKVDYAIRRGDDIVMLIEAKPVKASLSIENASQLYRYFSVTKARIAVLTNGVVYRFFSDLDEPNKLDPRDSSRLQRRPRTSGRTRTAALRATRARRSRSRSARWRCPRDRAGGREPSASLRSRARRGGHAGSAAVPSPRVPGLPE